MLSRLIGPVFIAIAAILWSTDTLVRLPAVEKLDPAFIVFVEHLLGTVAIVPLLLLRPSARRGLFQFTALEWLALAIVGVGGSALATVLFTMSFRYVNPSVVILLQKLQPVAVVLLAFAILGEKPRPRFYPWSVVALAAAVVISFPDFNFSFLNEGLDMRSRGVLYGLAAAGIWAVTTVCGKALLRRHPAGKVTFWRFALGLLALTGFVLATGIAHPTQALTPLSLRLALLYMSLIPGVLAMFCYYIGLNRTPASVGTFVELLYPVSAVAMNAVFLASPLTASQLGAGAILLVAVTRISS